MSAQLINIALRALGPALQYGLFKNGWGNTILKALGFASKGVAGSMGLREKLMIGMSAGSALITLANNFLGGAAPQEAADVAKQSAQSTLWDTVNSLFSLTVPGGDTLSTVQKVGSALFGTGALNSLLGTLAKSGKAPLEVFNEVANPEAGGTLLANIGKAVASGNLYNLPQALVHLKNAADAVADASGSKWKLIPGIY